MEPTKEKILIVDDEQDMLTTIGFILSDAGYNVIKASSGKECIALASSEKPDLILLDIKMPGMDGVETTDILRNLEQTRSIPITYLSNLVDEKEVIDGHVMGSKIGDLYFIPKTYSAEKILELVRLSLHHP